MKLSDVTVKEITEFKDLYKWVCGLPIDGADRRILMDVIDVSCKLNTKLLREQLASE
jgi:hypothetical protein|tara:strand:+ start:1227 stop:1397 length:171 start_codon:yes stop_codon:yes gene_type:complete